MSTLSRTPAQCKPGYVFLALRFDPEQRRRLKVLAAETGSSIQAIVTEAIRRYLLDEGAPRIPQEGTPE